MRRGVAIFFRFGQGYGMLPSARCAPRTEPSS